MCKSTLGLFQSYITITDALRCTQHFNPYSSRPEIQSFCATYIYLTLISFIYRFEYNFEYNLFFKITLVI